MKKFKLDPIPDSNEGYNEQGLNDEISDELAKPIMKDRKLFIKKTYTHLLLGIVAFFVLSFIIGNSVIGSIFAPFVLGNYFLIIAVLIVFGIIHTFLQDIMEFSNKKLFQYSAFIIYITLESILISPIIFLLKDTLIFPIAFLMTFAIFAVITLIAFVTKKDFEFLGSFLTMGLILGLITIVLSFIFGFNLGIIFSAFMVCLASGYILYDTSKIINKYSDHQYIAAAGSLMASIILLLWYLIRILIEILNIIDRN